MEPCESIEIMINYGGALEFSTSTGGLSIIPLTKELLLF